MLGLLFGGLALLAVFTVIETRIAEPMFQLSLFRIRAFTAGSIAGLLVAIARGGLQFMLIIWLQGIWLPLHGYHYSDTPLWAGIFLLPLTAGFLVSGPVSGTLSDRFGSRGIATAGMAVFGGSFIGLMLLPVDFSYWAFALLIAANGIGSGMFAAPNSSSIMGSVPARHRGAASGMRSTFQNSGTALSIGVFFSLMIAGLASSLPQSLTQGLVRYGVPHGVAAHAGSLPPVSSLFAAVLGVNPIQHLLAAAGVLASLPADARRVLTGREFFPQLISQPFHNGLTVVFAVAAGLAALAGVASLLRGGRYVHPELTDGRPPPAARPPAARPLAARPPAPARAGRPQAAPPASPAPEITPRKRSTMPLSTLDAKPALVVIDLQKGIAALPGVPALDDVIARSASLAAAFRRHGLPVVLVNVTGGPAGRTDISRPAFTRPPDWTDIVEALDQQPGDLLVTKQTWGAFHGTPLDTLLRERDVTQIVLTGVSTSAGVESTARAAHEHGYHVVLATDAMADRDADAHAHSVQRVFPRLGETATTGDILAMLGKTR